MNRQHLSNVPPRRSQGFGKDLVSDWSCLVSLLGLIIALSGCLVDVTSPTPTAMPAFTAVAAAPTHTLTATPIPSDTPAPTATATPIPSDTPAPTATATLLPTATPTPTSVPASFEPAPCRFANPRRLLVDCGYLTVPEDRRQPGESKTIRLHVAVFHSRSATPRPDPFLYLHGGPGGHILNQVPLGVVEQFDDVLADRDVILFDQRGVGYSEPALDCPEVTRHFYETLNTSLTPPEAVTQEVAARAACRDRLLAEGVNLAAYTTAASAADVEDLRRLLGYSQWNLYGISYGTRLALTVMRDYPQGVRSVILDSVAPLDVDFFADLAPNAQRAFDTLFTTCAADAACNAAYPDLKTVFYGLVAQLTVAPVKLDVLNLFTGQFHTIDFDGEDAVDFLFDLLYDTSTIPVLPEIIYAAAAGDFQEVSRRLELSLIEPAFISEAAPYSVWCSEESPFTNPEAVAAADRDLDQPVRDLFAMTVQAFFDTCAIWGAVAADPIEDQPVSSDVPTLILAGQFDPITPPAWGRRVADSLSHVYFYEFPGTGHGIVYAHLCGQAMAEAFIVDPAAEPDAGCVNEPGLHYQTP